MGRLWANSEHTGGGLSLSSTESGLRERTNKAIQTSIQDLGISLERKRSYLGYPTVTLLGQRVDGLGLTTVYEKIKATANLQFPVTLKDLDIYLGLTDWLRSSIPYCTQITEPLQTRKTILFKASPAVKRKRAETTYPLYNR